jgi:4-hydroxy-tetrahydrodipicolinate synthase
MFKGSMVALVTPMLENGSLDMDSLKNLVGFHIENQTDGLVILGTTGEAPTITHDEHKAIVKFVVKQVAGKIPVISGVGSNSTQQTIMNAQADVKLGIDGLLISTPYYNKPTQDGLYQHYNSIAQAVDKPIILYNVPSRTAVDLLPETVAKLAELSNIIAIKETVSIDRVQQLRAVLTDEFKIYSGDDLSNLEMLLAGANGLISVTANVAPQLLHQMYQNVMQNEIQQAQAIHDKLTPLHCDLFIESNPIPIKYALMKLGLINKGIRLPLTWLSAPHQKLLDTALCAASIGEQLNA